MTSGNTPAPPGSSLSLDQAARRRGRLGLAIPWEQLPWWGIIVVLVGVFVGYSTLTNTRYVDALKFILDLPWDRDIAVRGESSADGSWSLTVQPALEAGQYALYAEFLSKQGDIIGRTDHYYIEVPQNAQAAEGVPLTQPGSMVVQVQTSTPTISGSGPADSQVVLYDDYSGNLWRILKRMANANGVLLTLRTTVIAFAGALLIGLIFGVMRVSRRSPDLTINAGKRWAWGGGLFGMGLVAGWVLVSSQALSETARASLYGTLTNPLALALILVGIEAFMFLLPAMPYTLSTLYVEIVRGVPMLVIILYMGFAVTPGLRAVSDGWIDLRGLPAAILGLAFGYGAYLAEVFRAGIQSIPKGQTEAARSLGMSYFQAMRYVVLPQAIRVVLPPLGNDLVSMLKDSSLISVVALPELLQQGRLWISRNFRAFEGFNSVMLLYLVMTLLLSLLVRFIERRTALPGR